MATAVAADRTALVERSRMIVLGTLGVSARMVAPPGYRDAAPAGLAGDYLGGFAQPGVILASASAVRMSLTDMTSASLADPGVAGARGNPVPPGCGVSIDEYGEAQLELRSSGDRIEMIKRYAPGDAIRGFRYVGVCRDGVIAGYWQSLLRSSFRGVFWLARVDRLEPTTRTALDARVRATSPRRTLAKLVFSGLIPAGFIGGLVWPPLFSVSVGAFIVLTRTVKSRAHTLGAEADRWRVLLG